MERCGLAVVTIGNSLRGDDGIAGYLCDALPAYVSSRICRFDLGPYSGLVADCLSGHDAAIIIDATQNGSAAGTVSICDLSHVLQMRSAIHLKSCHGFSLADELQMANSSASLPNRLAFFGVEVESVDWGESLSETLKSKLPELAANLGALIQEMLEIPKDYA